jgi:hypothetical protein
MLEAGELALGENASDEWRACERRAGGEISAGFALGLKGIFIFEDGVTGLEIASRWGGKPYSDVKSRWDETGKT